MLIFSSPKGKPSSWSYSWPEPGAPRCRRPTWDCVFLRPAPSWILRWLWPRCRVNNQKKKQQPKTIKLMPHIVNIRVGSRLSGLEPEHWCVWQWYDRYYGNYSFLLWVHLPHRFPVHTDQHLSPASFLCHIDFICIFTLAKRDKGFVPTSLKLWIVKYSKVMSQEHPCKSTDSKDCCTENLWCRLAPFNSVSRWMNLRVSNSVE